MCTCKPTRDPWAPVIFACKCGLEHRNLADLLNHYRRFCPLNADRFAYSAADRRKRREWRRRRIAMMARSES